MTDRHREPRRAPAERVTSTPEDRALLAATAMAAMLALAGWAGGCGQGQAGPAAGPGTPPATSASTSTPASRPLPAACELLTPADVESVTREASGSLSSTLEDAVGKDPGQCSYPVGSGAPPRVVSLAVRRFASPGQAASQQQTAESGLRSMVAGSQVEDLPRLGDGAFWVGGQIDQLNVRRGDTLLSFTVQLDKEPLRAARQLADKALGRLAAPPAAGGPHPGARP